MQSCHWNGCGFLSCDITRSYFYRGCRGRDCMVVGFISTYAIGAYHHYHDFEPHQDEVYSIQYYVIKFVSDLRQVNGFLQFPQPIKPTHDITEIFLKVALNTIKPN